MTLNWRHRMNRLTTFGFILCIWAVTIKIAHLVWFSARLFRRLGELCQCIIRCSGRECEIEDASPHRRHWLSFSADEIWCDVLKDHQKDYQLMGGIQETTRCCRWRCLHMLSPWLLPLLQSMMMDRGRRKRGEYVTGGQFHPNTKSCRSFIYSSTLPFVFFKDISKMYRNLVLVVIRIFVIQRLESKTVCSQSSSFLLNSVSFLPLECL